MSAENSSRKKNILLLSLFFIAVAAGAGAWWFKELRGCESTDDAYVAGNVVPVMPQVAGNVVTLHADDTQLVQAGMPLVEMDPTDAKLALVRSEIQLAQTLRQVQQQMAELKQFDATIALRQAELDRVAGDQNRREVLGMTNAVGKEEVLHARQNVVAGKAALQVAIQQRNTLQAKLKNTPLAEQPEVRQAAEQVRQAWLDLQRTTILSPVSGVIAKRSVQVGSHVAVGAPLMAVVPLDQLWVDANFKEVQLEHLRIGQPVELSADLYGDKIVYHGEVEGLAAGTGSVFSLLPAQNATGNWLKVVQRLPVRIKLRAEELQQHPLRLGLSMLVTVDVSNTDGPLITEAQHKATLATTQSLNVDLAGADERVRQIIVANRQAD
ncbi:MAG: HlyD family efflux transporter periplasmic adaptor subunit [Aeromonadaceae bacterium]|nr:HlyD family efflux transporter periplasmic adaptor subunit [Aeromonadaceae bacterium]